MVVVLAVASAPTAGTAMEIEVVPVSTVTALVLVATAAAPTLEVAAVAVGPGIAAGTTPVAAVARAATEIAASWKTVRWIAAAVEQPPELRWPQALHAPCDHYEYVSICRAQPEP